MEKTVYRSRVDWWVWLMMALALGVVWQSAFNPDTRLFGIIMGTAMTVLFALMLFGYKYVIDGDRLLVYKYFIPTELPIYKISGVAKSTGCLGTFGLSCRRVSISFDDRSVLKSNLPLAISPADRDAFIDRLMSINPDIKYV